MSHVFRHTSLTSFLQYMTVAPDSLSILDLQPAPSSPFVAAMLASPSSGCLRGCSAGSRVPEIVGRIVDGRGRSDRGAVRTQHRRSPVETSNRGPSMSAPGAAHLRQAHHEAAEKKAHKFVQDSCASQDGRRFLFPSLLEGFMQAATPAWNLIGDEGRSLGSASSTRGGKLR